jgi:hypothetical protein
VALILAINAGVLFVVLKKQAKNENLLNNGQVTLSNGDLNKLGLNKTVIGDSGVQLTVAPDAQFKGKLAVQGPTTLSDQVMLNGKLLGTEASFTQLQSGKTSLSELNVNGKSSLSDLALRKDLNVIGNTTLQGAVTITQLLTLASNLNVSGNISVGGTLSVNTFNVRNISISGHLKSSGPVPNIGKGSAVGSNGTVSISGNDSGGTISVNVGVGGGSGILVSVAFRTQYSSPPSIVFSPVGGHGNFYLSSSSSAGFSIAVSGALAPGGYRFNYIVIE